VLGGLKISGVKKRGTATRWEHVRLLKKVWRMERGGILVSGFKEKMHEQGKSAGVAGEKTRNMEREKK